MLPGRFWTLLDRGRAKVAKPGIFKKPQLGDGPLKDLNDALHALHLRAGRPSLTEMYAALSEEAKKSISRSTLHSALANTALPRRDTVDALVEILGTRARNTTPEEELPGFDALWQLASEEIASDALADVPALDLSSLIEWHLDRHPEDVRQVFRLLDEFLSEGASGWRDRILDLYRVLLTKGMDRGWNLPDSFPRDVFPRFTGISKGDDGKPTGFRIEIDKI
jgi:hypothetical protein